MDRAGNSALHYAAGYGRAQLLEHLLARSTAETFDAAFTVKMHSSLRVAKFAKLWRARSTPAGPDLFEELIF